jgi:2-phosphosulfolactate phosphatase
MSHVLTPIRLKVDLLPRGPYPDIVVVVDVLRATTAVPLLLGRGVSELYLTPSLRTAREFARKHGHVLIGERDGLPPEGFHYGASPADLARADLTGKTVVMTTQNGPRTLPVVQDAPEVVLASFYNARAVVGYCQRLLAGATETEHKTERELAIVCAGHDGGESLEDTLAAGFLARRLETALAGRPVVLRDAARLAMALVRAYPDPQEAIFESQAGHMLRRLNLHEDIAFASLVSQTDAVPRLGAVVMYNGEPLYRFDSAITR